MDLKRCSKCLVEKPLDAFHRCKLSSKGVYPSCKSCKNLASKTYNQSYLGYQMRMYASIKDRIKHNKTYAGRTLTFTLGEFLKWIETESDYKKLYNDWVASGYDHKISPSLDRIVNSGDYSLDNIQVIPFGANSTKGNYDRWKAERRSRLIASFDIGTNLQPLWFEDNGKKSANVIFCNKPIQIIFSTTP